MIRALVIDDSAFNRVTLARMLASEEDVEVVATAINGEEGIKQVLKSRPDVITLDLEMPVMDGFAFLRWLMANHPTPVIVVSSRSSDKSVFKALELGAVDFIAKPGGRVSPRLEEIQSDLLGKVRQATNVRLDNVRKRIRDEEPPRVSTGKVQLRADLRVDLVVIGCSTGGPPALQSLLQSMPLLPLPFVVAQHMPPNFTRLFAERVNRLTHYRVKEAEDGETLQPAVVYVAPGGRQTEIKRMGETMTIRVFDKRADDLYAPSVNCLFDSASEVCGERLVAVILTGMGDDGTAAIQRVRARGGRTIAESAATAIIFGMPGEAIRSGAIEEVLPLPEIPRAISRFCV
jgi:two-component system chemotaxis response regulator CheB